MAKEQAKPQATVKAHADVDPNRLQLVGCCLMGLLARPYPEPPEVVAEKARDYADAALAAISGQAKSTERN